MPKKEKSLISVGAQFKTLRAFTGALIAELSWRKKKNRSTQNVAKSLIAEAPLSKKRLSGRLKVERI